MATSENLPLTTHYPESVATDGLNTLAENQPLPEINAKLAALYSPEGYLELEAESRELQQALALDFDIWASELSDTELHNRAEPFVKAINEQRANLPVELPGDTATQREPVDVATASPTLLRHFLRPNWHEHFPADNSTEAEQEWETFVKQWPSHIQINLEELRAVDGDLRTLAADPGLMKEVADIRSEHIEIMRQASTYLVAERRQVTVDKQIAAVYQVAAISNRSLTKAEQRRLVQLQANQATLYNRQKQAVTSEAVVEEIAKRRAIQDRRDLEQGLLLTNQMKEIIDELLPALLAGKPALLVGETGGAKTALAEFIARRYMDKEPILISGYGDVNSYQLMGKPTLQEKDGVPVSEFAPGPAVRAMEEGRPLILDEINAMPADFLKRLNKIVQLRPGDTFEVQEDSGRKVTIKPGFCIIATANEKSKRYKGIEDLSVEFQNRFGANVVRVYYPDHDIPDDRTPKDNLRLAYAALRDRAGNTDPSIDDDELRNFVHAAHITQKVFSQIATSEHSAWVDTDAIRDRRPGLEETVIAPRTMVDILSKIKGSHGNINFNQALQRFVDGIKNPKDRKVITTILKGHNFLN
jgi:MoxR-like ATPase